MNAARQLQGLLGLRLSPVAVTFLDSAPASVPPIDAAGPSSCAYWKLAAEGRTFYTREQDHFNCPIGAYTHGVAAPAEVMQELQGVVTMMVSLNYLRAEEVPSIPKRDGRFGVAVYAPLAQWDGEPSAVVVCGNARQMMMLAEAANAAGVGGAGLMGRPTCAALPEAMRTGRGVASLGCIGNRVYTEMTDDEQYYVLPGNQLNAVAEKLASIVHANRELEKYHKARKEQLAAARTD